MRRRRYADGGPVGPTDNEPDDGSQDEQPSPVAVPINGANDAKMAAINKLADISSLKQDPIMQNMVQGMAGGTVAPMEVAGQKAIQNITPELFAKLQSLYENPNQLLQTQGPMDMAKFQKLRDILGLRGPIQPK